ncbi:Ubiquitin carboxyl-terminal hydrolase family protein, partial [Reticulomyxa filosa]
VGYLCDNGMVAAAEIHIRQPGKLFIYFLDEWQRIPGEKFMWIMLPSTRLRPKPTRFPPNYMASSGALVSSYPDTVSRSIPTTSRPQSTSYVKREEPVYQLEPSKYNPNSKNLYVLTGVLIHQGTPYHGHYHTYIRDFMWEGPKQPSKPTTNEKDNESKTEAIEDAEQYWYDFNDSVVTSIEKTTVAKQYGGNFECAYMLLYRRLDRMNSVPVQYINEYNAAARENRLKAIEENNAIEVKILLPSCFEVNTKNNTLTMQPFVVSLLKQFIRNGQMKQLEKDRPHIIYGDIDKREYEPFEDETQSEDDNHNEDGFDHNVNVN